jgi:cell division protein FtsL
MTHFLTQAEARKRKNRAGLAIGLATCLVSALVFGFIWQRIYLGRQLAEIEQMAARNQELAAEGKRLLSEVESINSWSAVERAAGERLGMTYPEKSQVAAAIRPPSPKGQGMWTLARSLLVPVSSAWSQP